jgi:hypothetical protein
VAAAAIDNLAALVAQKGSVPWRVRERTRLAATRLPTDAATVARVDALVSSTMDSPHATAVDQLADVLHFRYEMTRELA